MKLDHYKKIASEYGVKSAKELADEMPYSASTITQTVYKLRKAGVKVGNRDRKDEFQEAVSELLD